MLRLPQQITSASVLLVEGSTPEWFFKSLLRHLGRGGTQIVNFGGVSQLSGMVTRVGSDPFFRAKGRKLAIVRDAETDAAAAFQSVSHALAKIDLPTPRAAGAWSQATPSVGVYIFPDNQSSGMIETLCLAGESAARRACAIRFAECMAAQGIAAPRDKEMMQSLLAISGVGNPQVGAAARANYFGWNSPVFESLCTFVAELE